MAHNIDYKIKKDAGETRVYFEPAVKLHVEPYDGDREIELINTGGEWLPVTGEWNKDGRFIPDVYMSSEDMPAVPEIIAKNLKSINAVASEYAGSLRSMIIDLDDNEWGAVLVFDGAKIPMAISDRFLNNMSEFLEGIWMSYGLKNACAAIPSIYINGKIVEVDVPTVGHFEKSVDILLDKIDENPAQVVLFNGVEYKPPEENVSKIINDEAERVGSLYRIGISYIEDSEGKFKVNYLLYGRAAKEIKKKVGDQIVRVVDLEKVERRIGFGYEINAFTVINLPFVMIPREHSRETFEYRKERNRIREGYQTSLHREIYKEFFTDKNAPLDNKNIDLFSELLSIHELAHWKIKDKFGYEIKALRHELRLVGFPQYLDQVEEILADIYVLDEIVNMAKKDQRRARQAYMIWAIYRGPNLTNEDRLMYEECIGDLLLHAGSLEKEKSFTIDWAELKKTAEGMRKVTEAIIQDEVLRVCKMIESAVPHMGRSYKEIVKNYSKQELEKVYIKKSAEEIKISAINSLINLMLSYNPPDGELPPAVDFVAPILGDTSKINEYLHGLGVPESTQPMPLRLFNIRIGDRTFTIK